MENSFLPPNYEKPALGSKYLKFLAGDNKFRILSGAIVGYVDWQDLEDGNRKPIRTKEKPKQSFDPLKPCKHFWTFIVWDYRDEAIKILEITQVTIQDAIFNLHSDDNWGDPREYDLNIRKTGNKLETKYTIIPMPPKKLSVEIIKLFKETNINLEALYSGDDPFNSSVKKIQEEEKEEISLDEVSF